MEDAAERLERVEVALTAVRSGLQLSLFAKRYSDRPSVSGLGRIRSELLEQLHLFDFVWGCPAEEIVIGGRRYYRATRRVQ